MRRITRIAVLAFLFKSKSGKRQRITKKLWFIRFPSVQIFLTRLPDRKSAKSCAPQLKVATVHKIPWSESEKPSVSRRYPSKVPVTKRDIKYSKVSQTTKAILVIFSFFAVFMLNHLDMFLYAHSSTKKTLFQ